MRTMGYGLIEYHNWLLSRSQILCYAQLTPLEICSMVCQIVYMVGKTLTGIMDILQVHYNVQKSYTLLIEIRLCSKIIDNFWLYKNNLTDLLGKVSQLYLLV